MVVGRITQLAVEPVITTAQSLPPKRDRHDVLSDMAQAAAHYFRALIEAGLPEALAVRMAGDWHAAQLAQQQQEAIERAVRRAVRRRPVSEGR